MVSNVNIPNEGQIQNLPYGAIVETNAVFRDGSVTPVFAGNVPKEIFSLISRALGEQEIIVEAAARRDLDLAFSAFSNNALVNLSLSDARALFDEMVDNTKEYLQEYFR